MQSSAGLTCRRAARGQALPLVCSLLVGTAGCGGARAPSPPAPAPSAPDPVPEWIRRTPSPPGEICAVGSVDRTFFAQDARRRAAEAARVELAKTVEVRVKSVMYDYQSTRGGWVRSSDVVAVVESVAEGVLHGAEVRAVWRDDRGAHLAPGMTHALACLRTDVPVEKLAGALEEAWSEATDDEVEGVRRRAQDAFDELSQLESAPPGDPGEVNNRDGTGVDRPEEAP